ncbi:MAG: thermonuclease family protein [Rhodospirillaceae bacterium]|nr:thermonuclease family protein [Rhodospirillaceae bacterium]
MRRGGRAAALIFCLWPAALPAGAAAAPDTLRPAGEARVVDVISGATVRLASGDIARLAGVDAPRLADRSGRPWPHAAASRRALAALVLDRWVRLFHVGRRIDRYGRLIVHLFVGPRWVQGALVSAGHVRVRSYAGTRLRIAELLAREDAARRAGLGLWAHRRYAVRTAGSVRRDLDSWQIVEGTVRAVAAFRDVTYLNFDDDWRTDFTVRIGARARRLFRTAGIDLRALKGRIVRVRGWVRQRNGPLIVATHPEQIERLPTAPDRQPGR